jgi:hypothetical protein
MIKHSHRNLLLTVAAAALISTSVLAGAANATHATKKKPAVVEKAKPTEAAKSTDEVVAYKDLEQRIGAELAIETTLNTVRRGTLIKYTNPGLTIRLGPESGSIDLEVPAETVRRVTIVTPAPAPQENGSAKKN